MNKESEKLFLVKKILELFDKDEPLLYGVSIDEIKSQSLKDCKLVNVLDRYRHIHYEHLTLTGIQEAFCFLRKALKEYCEEL